MIQNFTVQVTGLAETARVYRVGGAICYAATRELRAQYGDQVDVVVSLPEGPAPAAISDPPMSQEREP